MKRALYQELATIVDARLRCEKVGNAEWYEKHTEVIEHIEKNFLPSGSGIDSGCKIDLAKSTGEKIVITSSYHTMDDNGMYAGWIDFTVTITASLQFGLNLSIKGNFGKHQDLKDYLHEVFSTDLTAEKDHTEFHPSID